MTEEIENAQNGVEGLSREMQIFSQISEQIAEDFAKLSKEGKSFSQNFSSELSSAMRSVVVDGQSLGAALRNMALSLADQSFQSAIKPINTMIAQGVASLLPFADGGVIENAHIQRFANGGIVNAPTTFPLRNGMGLMGEAGAEAIMPLARGADGKLGVRAGSSSRVNVNIHVASPDVESFHKSKRQIASQLKRAIESAGG